MGIVETLNSIRDEVPKILEEVRPEIAEAFIQYVELALDYNLPIEPDKLKKYYELIEERRKTNEP